MARKNYGKWPQKMVHLQRAENEKSLHANFARTSVKGKETVKEKGIKETRTVIVSEIRIAIKTESRTGSVTGNGTEERTMTKKVGARDTIDMKTMTAMDDVPHEIMGGETRIGTGRLIKTRIVKGIGRRNTGIIEIRIKKKENEIEMEEESAMEEEIAKRGTVLEIGLMMCPHRSERSEREVPHYTGRKGLEINATCMMIVCKMIEPKKLVVTISCLLTNAKCFSSSAPGMNVRTRWKPTAKLFQRFELKRRKKEKSSMTSYKECNKLRGTMGYAYHDCGIGISIFPILRRVYGCLCFIVF
jgi:hypothetical protein